MHDDNFEKEFEEFLDGDSDLNTIYADSKTQLQPSQGSIDRVNNAVHGNQEATSLVDFSIKTSYLIPFSIAATLLLAMTVFWFYPPQPTHQLAQTGGENMESVPENSADLVEVTSVVPASTTDPKASAIIEHTAIATAVPEKHRHDSKEKRLQESTGESIVTIAKSNLSHADGTVSITESEQPEQESLTEADPVEDSEELDLSNDWIQALAGSGQNPDQFTSMTSARVSAEAWMEKIMLLHKHNRRKEVIENIKKFEKAYPKYKLPAVIINNYK